ncbi:hypothetical protein MKK55_07580 [Methylobacterium sp. J-059]|uniref:PGN_0703 family putative restriction endonuclease n=1 Tax=Methylobacterium sp. J-059 TaxID=2836643 RepID=UPI001FB985AD|nr:hypothetical protein [Methylobacterium sp. J-059]MCJ2038815.1 hypothetical protein [Methylobacterium sp. J-059]
MTASRFDVAERLAQGAHLAAVVPDHVGYAGAAYRLQPDQWTFNLAPAIRASAPAYFKRYGITWHQHRNHGLSSQVSCLNFLMPLAEHPEVLSRLVAAALGIDAPEMLPVEDGPEGRPWFVGFEWVGACDYLNEGAVRTRGANATSADAILRFRHRGRSETLLVEWKYTEAYGAPIPPAGNPTRTKRYQNLAFAPAGPVRSDLGLALPDFFYEPFYQLLRQQMLAVRMQAAGEGDAARVRVLHIAPGGNGVLQAVTAPALRPHGTSAFAAFRSVLTEPEAFVSRATETLFGPLLRSPNAATAEWAAYLRDRYRFLDHAPNAAQGPVN